MDPNNPSRAYWGPEITNVNDIASIELWAQNCTDEEYRAHFADLQAKMSPIKLGNPDQYLSIASACSIQGTPGKDGRGITTIRKIAGGAGHPTTTYEILYDDGATSTFEVYNGIDGKNGVGSPGDDGISSKFVAIYRTADIDPVTKLFVPPPQPEGGTWDGHSSTISNLPSGWSRNDNVEPPVFMSTRTFASVSTAQDPSWSVPVQITGENGKPGTDGLSTEFIYRLLPTKPTDVPDLPSPSNVPAYVPANWTPSPTGIDEKNPTEWMCVRRMTATGWGPWEGPSRWAQYGASGQDGDGVQYIYYRENLGKKPTNPTPKGYQTDIRYQDKDLEWTPNTDEYDNFKGAKILDGTSWKDNPLGVEQNNRFEWVAIRKYRSVDWSNPTGEHRWCEFSEPTLWSKYGEKGESAVGTRVMYKITTGTDDVPKFNQFNEDPGFGWSTTFPPEYEADKHVVWGISAVINFGYVDTNDDGVADFFVDTTKGWEGPYIVTGVKGTNGNPIDYTQIFYAYANSKPTQPNNNVALDKDITSTDEKGNEVTWHKFPEAKYEDPNDNTKRWYQCTAHVDGHTKTVKEWGPVQTLNGIDGQAKDGNRYEYRFGVSPNNEAPRLVQYDKDSNTWLRVPLTVNDNNENVEGWSLTDIGFDVPENGSIWMIWAQIDPNDKLIMVDGKAWSGPIRINGVKGDRGPAGMRGFTGVPGVSLNTMFCKGTVDEYEGSDEWEDKVMAPTGWSKNVPETDGSEYVWCIQGSDLYTEEVIPETPTEPAKNVFKKTGIDWIPPFKITGNIGPEGPAGNRGQIIYPMGIYNPNEVYITTEDKAPYVYDPDARCFYVYDNTSMPWCGERPSDYTDTDKYGEKYYFAGQPVAEQGRGITPGIHYANCLNANKTPSWVMLESFQALYTNIAIIANGLVGSAVFNNEFMFSQQGIDRNGAPSNDYENFLDGYDAPHTLSNPTDRWVYAGTTVEIDDADVDPYEVNDSEVALHSFRPNVCINFKTGEIWCSTGKVNFDADGSGKVANGGITWNSKGEVTIGLLNNYVTSEDYQNDKDGIGDVADKLAAIESTIEQWGSDGFITPLEKTDLYIRLQEITNEWSNIYKSATLYGISTANFIKIKNDALAVLKYYTSEEQENIEIIDKFPLQYIYDYYEERENLRHLINKAAYDKSDDNTVVTDSMNELAQTLGYEDFNSFLEEAKTKETIITGGVINTSLIDTDAIVTKVMDAFDVTAENIENSSKKWGLLIDGTAYFASSNGVANAHILFNNDGSGQIGNPESPGIVWDEDGTLFINRNAGEKMRKINGTTISSTGYTNTFTPEYTTLYVQKLGSGTVFMPTITMKLSPIFDTTQGYKGTLKIINPTDYRIKLTCDTTAFASGTISGTVPGEWTQIFRGFRSASSSASAKEVILPPYSNFTFDLYEITEQYNTNSYYYNYEALAYNQFNNYYADGSVYPAVLGGNKVLLRDVGNYELTRPSNMEYILLSGVTNCDKIEIDFNGSLNSSTICNIYADPNGPIAYNSNTYTTPGMWYSLTPTATTSVVSASRLGVPGTGDYVSASSSTQKVEFKVREVRNHPLLSSYYYFSVYVATTNINGDNMLNSNRPIVRFYNDVGECGYYTM
jgi:hypothetical protein